MLQTYLLDIFHALDFDIVFGYSSNMFNTNQ